MKKGFINKLKGVLASAAAVVVTVGMIGGNAIPAMAADGVVVNAKTEGSLVEGSSTDTDKLISIKSPSGIKDNDTVTYHVYKVFDATYSGNAVSYTALETEDSFPITADDNGSRFTKDSTGYIHYQTSTDNGTTWNDNTTDVELSASMIEKLGTLTTKFTDLGSVAITGPEKTAYVRVQNYGYYYITSTTGTVVAINTAHPTASMNDKNTVPTVDKVEDHSTSALGDTVAYTATVHLKEGSESVVFHDKLSSGLTLDGVAPTSVKVGDSDLSSTTDYTITTWTASPANNGENIVITFSDNFLKGVPKAGKDVVIKYTATVNENAVINENNNAYIKYGNESGYESTHKTVYNSTFKFKVNKVDGSNESLSGAKFVLSKDGSLGNIEADNDNELSQDVKSKLLSFDNSGKYSKEGTTFIREASNSLVYSGLDSTDSSNNAIVYYLYEVKAPSGFNKLTNPIAIKIIPTFDTNDDTKVTGYKIQYNDKGTATESDFVDATKTVTEIGTAQHTVADADAPEFNVQNKQGSVLPSTGGIGTTIFYVIGGVVVAGAVILLLARRRKNA